MIDIKQTMRSVIETEAQAISRIKVNDDFETAANMILDCKGKIITTGIGKAGYVAQRFAATLSSTGTPAFYSPGRGWHGDLGMLDNGDLILAFSTSGKSIEVIEMLRNAAELGHTKLLALRPFRFTSPENEHGHTGYGTRHRGALPLNLTPSATIAVMSAICDAIALTLIPLKSFTKEQYGLRHHKGYLGTIARQEKQYDSQD